MPCVIAGPKVTAMNKITKIHLPKRYLLQWREKDMTKRETYNVGEQEDIYKRISL